MITAVVLAAGLSTRMGQPKMMLKWGNKTVIEQVVSTLLDSDLSDIVVVAGKWFQEISNLVVSENVKVVFNPKYANGEMTVSLQTGLMNLTERTSYALVVLGDQPFIRSETIQKLIQRSGKTKKYIVMPSMNGRRGHPWLIARTMFSEIMAIKPPLVLRDFIASKNNEIDYVWVNDEFVMKDMDTPEEYQALKP